jgi:hypothetical protein
MAGRQYRAVPSLPAARGTFPQRMDALSCIHLCSRRAGCITKSARPVRRGGHQNPMATVPHGALMLDPTKCTDARWQEGAPPEPDGRAHSRVSANPGRATLVEHESHRRSCRDVMVWKGVPEHIRPLQHHQTTLFAGLSTTGPQKRGLTPTRQGQSELRDKRVTLTHPLVQNIGHVKHPLKLTIHHCSNNSSV